MNKAFAAVSLELRLSGFQEVMTQYISHEKAHIVACDR